MRTASETGRGDSQRSGNSHKSPLPKATPPAVEIPDSAGIPPDRASRLIHGIVVVFVFAIPLAYSFAGKDVFGLPKELLFRAEGLLILCVATVGWLIGDFPLPSFAGRSAVLVLPLCALIWSAVSTAASSRPEASFESMTTALFSVVIFYATLYTAPRNRALLVAMLGGAVVNAILVILEMRHIWKPFELDPPPAAPPALLGNPNVAGTYLVGPALAALALAFSSSGWRRVVSTAIGAILFAGIIGTATVTALIAFLAGALVLVVLRSGRAALVVILLLCIGLFAAPFAHPFRVRLERLEGAIERGSWNEIFTGRLVAYAAALEMGEERPLVGVGPGQFAWHYFDSKIASEKRHPRLFPKAAQVPGNFGEAHNDHLQVFAETGLPGYLVLLASIVVVARGSFGARRPEEEKKRRRKGNHSVDPEEFSRLCSLPLATAFFVVAVAQFPLQLAAPRITFLTLAAVCLTWSRRREIA